MESLVRLALLAALCLAVDGTVVRASYLSNIRDTSDLCAVSNGPVISCGEVSSEDGLAPHPDDCRLFYQCLKADAPAVCRQCPAGLHFNPALRVCDLPERAACKDVPTQNIQVPGEIVAPGHDIPQLCIENTITEVSCANVTSPDALLPHPDDCELFYYCLTQDTKPVCRQCNAGLHFNPRLHVCDDPEHAGCNGTGSDRPIPTPGPEEDGAERCRASSQTSVSCEHASPTDGLMAHPDDCSLYYQCLSAEAAAVCRPCNAGLHFNPDLRVCDAPEEAGCLTPTTVGPNP